MAERRTHALAATLLVAALALLGVGAVASVAGAVEGEPGAIETTGTSAPTDSPTVTGSTTPSATPTVSESPTESPTTSTSPTSPPTATVTTTVTATPVASTPVTSTPVQVQDALLRWGLSNESSNRAFAPGTFNFFSAGALADPGRGGVQIRQDQWLQRAGNVSVQKWNGTAWQPATWAGLGTDSGGNALGTPTAGTFSNHSFVFGAGTGTVDAAAGTAHLTWDGDVSVLYYSGMSFFVLSDPVLDVQGGTGEVLATLSGYSSSQADPTIWEPVAAQVVTVASLTQVDLSDARGFVVTPAYLGVLAAGVPQVTTGPSAGSFPQSFVDYHERLGSAPFWYSSGASTDAFKVALPMSVSLDAADEVVTSTASGTSGTKKPDKVKNSAPPPPTESSPDVVATPPARLPPAVVPPPALAPVAPPIAAAALPLLARPATSVRLVSSPATPVASSSAPAWPWWTGGVLLLLAAACLLLTPAAPAAKTTRS